jgi:hypothetical protein
MTKEPHIKIVKLVNGDDIVCSFSKDQLPSKSPLLRVEKPLQIKYISNLTPSGLKDYIALIKWASYTNDKIITIPKDKILTITNATDEMIRSYDGVAKTYDKIIPTKQGNYSQKKLTKEENEEFAELWDDFRDIEDEGTLH